MYSYCMLLFCSCSQAHVEDIVFGLLLSLKTFKPKINLDHDKNNITVLFKFFFSQNAVPKKREHYFLQITLSVLNWRVFSINFMD